MSIYLFNHYFDHEIVYTVFCHLGLKMDLWKLFLASIGAFAILHFFLAPVARRWWLADQSYASVGKAALYAGLEFLRTFFLLAIIAYSGFLLLLTLAHFMGGASTAELGAAIGKIQSWKAWFATVGSGWSTIVFFMLVLALGLLSYRSGRRFRKQELDQRFQRRRIYISSQPEEEIIPKLRGSARIKDFFVSEGLLTTFKGVSKAFFLIGLILLFLSLIGASAGSMAGALGDRIVLLEELQVMANLEEVNEAWQHVMAEAESSQDDLDLDEEDENILDELSSIFEESIFSAYLDSTASGVGSASYVMRTYNARQQILNRSLTQRSSAHHVQKNKSLAGAENLSAAEREAVEVYEKSSQKRGPKTEVGTRFRQELKQQVAKRSSRIWQDIKTKTRAYRSSFRRSASAQDVSRILLGKVFGQVLSGVTGELTEIQKQFKTLVDKVGSKALERMYDIKSRQFLTDLARNDGVEDAVRNLNRSDPNRPSMTTPDLQHIKLYASDLPQAETIVEKLRSQPPGLQEVAERHVDFQKARSAVKKLRNSQTTFSDRPLGLDVAEALATYEDWFPGQYGSETRTERGKLLNELNPEQHPIIRDSEPLSPPGGGPPSISSNSSTRGRGLSASRFSRSRNFTRLRGFSRIGGVLIGREPSNPNDSVPFADIRWQPAGNKFVIYLIREDGTEFQLGPFRKSMIHHALVYVADGRPTAVTMTTARPLRELRILLHPALIDAPIGCRVIELDRFVDQFTAADSLRLDAQQSVEAQLDLYRVAWSCRVVALVNQFGKSRIASAFNLSERQIADLYQTAARWLSSPATRRSATQVLSNPSVLSDPRRSPLLNKSEFFSEDLVKLMVECAASSKTLKAFQQHIQDKIYFVLQLMLVRGGLEWLIPPPDLMTWSGVRELPFELDPNLNFLRVDSRASDSAWSWPLDFMLQVAFASPPAFLPRSMDAEDYYDKSPWEYPNLKNRIAMIVNEGIEGSPKHKSVLEDMKEFTILQRLFRVALSGRFGEAFPVEKLVALTDETASSASEYTRTLRWNARPGLLEGAMLQNLRYVERALAQTALDNSDAEWINGARTAIQKCVSFIESSDSPQNISQELWQRQCALDNIADEANRMCDKSSNPGFNIPACLVLEAARHIEETTYARGLRLSLGIHEDDILMQAFIGCPAIN